MPQTEDLELARRIGARNPDALDDLVDRYHTPVYRFLRHLTRSVEDAEDLAQATLIRAMQGAGRYDGRAPLRSWLYGIAFREFGRWRRRRLWLPLPSTVAAPDEMGRIADAEVLLLAVAQMPQPMAAAWLLHEVEGLSVAEVAEALAIPEGTVKSRLHSARHKLRALLTESEELEHEPA